MIMPYRNQTFDVQRKSIGWFYREWKKFILETLTSFSEFQFLIMQLVSLVDDEKCYFKVW